jgi:hypothetical protein
MEEQTIGENVQILIVFLNVQTWEKLSLKLYAVNITYIIPIACSFFIVI